MIELGLSRVYRLLARVPLPWRAIHVAGTNGKGSICAYVSGMLAAYNASTFRQDSNQPVLKHGRFNSPHLIDRWDCITIDGETISESIFHQVEARVIKRNEEEDIQASEFELLTATAFEIFTQEKVDIGIIEVGIGGRLDATNVLGQLSGWDRPSECGAPLDQFRPKPLITAVSTIALDHQVFLGTTLEEISSEKAGIMKPGVPVVLAPNVEVVTKNLVKIAKEVGVSHIAHAEDTQGYEDLWRQPLKKDNEYVRKQNSAMAFTITWYALQQLDRLKVDDPVNLMPIIRAFHAVPANTIWPGRVQEISIACITKHEPLIILDGAHNTESAEALANTIQNKAGNSQQIVWVIAASQGKDIRSMLELFMSVQSKSSREFCSCVIATKFGDVDGMPWVKAMSPAEILDQVRSVVRDVLPSRTVTFHTADPDLRGALNDACEYARAMDGLVVVAGSLYLVGDVLRMVREYGGKIK